MRKSTFRFILVAALALFVFSGLAQSAERKMKVKFTSPKPGATVSGEVSLTYEITDSGRSDSSEPSGVYIASFFLDAELVGATSSGSETEFVLDTTTFEDGRHMLTVNVFDQENRIGTQTIWIRVLNNDENE